MARLERSFLAVELLLLCFAACAGPATHFVTPAGQAIPELDYLWTEVDRVFPDALPPSIKVVLVSGPLSSFMIETHSIGIPGHLKSDVRKGKISRELTHLALHALSGGDEDRPGRCFDNDVVFLEQAVAGYMDSKAAGALDEAVKEGDRQAADLVEKGLLSAHALRDWDTFYYRGYWSDQYKEWNLEGLMALVSLGNYLAERFGLDRIGAVFSLLNGERPLDQAMEMVLGKSTEEVVLDWLEGVRS